MKTATSFLWIVSICVLASSAGCNKTEPPVVAPAVVSNDRPSPAITSAPKPVPPEVSETATVKFEFTLNDPKMVVLLDGNEFRLADLNKEMKLKPGLHHLDLKLGNRTLQRTEFSVAKDQRLIVELFDTERRAAEWTLQHGGRVDVFSDDGKRISVSKDDKSNSRELPGGLFRVIQINLNGSKELRGLDPLNGLEAITHLFLNNTKVEDAALANIKALKTLKHLSLAGVPLSDAGIVHLKELTGIERLNFAGSRMTDIGLGHLGGLATLQALNVRDAKITDNGLAILRDLKQLKELNLEHTPIAGSGIAHLQGLPIWYLSLGESPSVGNECVKHLHGLDKLTWLRLSFTKVTDEGVGELKGLKLSTLGLAGTTVSDAGLASLKDMTSLTYLNLEKTPLTDASLPTLKALPKLTHLFLSETKISDAAKAELLKTLPKAKISP